MESVKGLEQVLERMKREDPRQAGEYAFALASIYRDRGDTGSATRFAGEAIALFEAAGTNTVEDCSARNIRIHDVTIPELIHEQVVRTRFKDLL